MSTKTSIIVSCGLFTTLFLFMAGFLVRFVSENQQDMVNNSYNSRQEILLSQNYRGTIYSRDGEILAETVMDSAQNETRVYPFENLFSHVVGYSTNGRMGVEAQANYYLINTNTSISNKVANDMAGVKNPGDNVFTTLDVQIQQVADEQLSIYKGAVVVTEVSTGKILAMVSHPDFDPNEISEIWSSLISDSESSVLVNRATQGLYPPGSTFKIITALEYIRENPDSFQKYNFKCPGYYKYDGNRINCYHGISHGNVDFERSFAKSCNSSFANIGMTLDRASFSNTLQELLFGGELPLTLSYSQSSTVVSTEMSDNDMMQTSIGQGQTQITPIHLNMITSAIANDGILMKPYVVEHVENAEGNVIKNAKRRFGDRYDFSESVYIDSTTPIKVRCPKHGYFYIEPYKLTEGDVYEICPECYKEGKWLIERMHKRFPNKYETDEKFNFISLDENVTIICKEHGYIDVSPMDILY